MVPGNTQAICSKELKRYFASPIGYTLLAGSALLFGLGAGARNPIAVPQLLLLLTGFSPGVKFRGHARLTLLVALARLATIYLVPLISMRLFVEERRSRTLEILFTSPVREWDIIWGKWAAAWLLYLAILAVSLLELAAFGWPEVTWRLTLAAYAALLLEGAGLLALGEYISTLTIHEGAAALGTLGICILVLRYYASGILASLDYATGAALLIAGWSLTWRSVRKLRWAY